MNNAIRHINVLEAPAKSVGQGEVTYLAVLIVFAITALVCGGYSLWKLQQIKAEKQVLSEVLGSVSRLQALVAPKQKEVSGKDVLKKLRNPILWSPILKRSMELIPESIGLSQLNASIGDKRTLNFIANSKSKNLMMLMKSDLATLPECVEVRLGSVTEISFELECVLK